MLYQSLILVLLSSAFAKGHSLRSHSIFKPSDTANENNDGIQNDAPKPPELGLGPHVPQLHNLPPPPPPYGSFPPGPYGHGPPPHYSPYRPANWFQGPYYTPTIQGILETDFSSLINLLKEQLEGLKKQIPPGIADSYDAFEKKIDEVLEGVREKLAKLKLSVTESITGVQGEFTQFKDKFQQYGVDALEQAKEKVNAVSEVFTNQVENLKDSAHVVGVDIKACLKGKEQKILDLSDTYGKDIVHCVQNIMDEGQHIVDEATHKFNNHYGNLEILNKKLKDCHGALTCVAESYGKIAYEMAEMPIRISVTLIEASKFIGKLQFSLGKCAVDNGVDVAVLSASVVGEVGACIKEKLDVDGIAAKFGFGKQH